MKNYERVYSSIMADHLTKYRQMIFLSGPRQVGKTTLATGSATAYVSWDKDKDRQTILSGADALAAKFTTPDLVRGTVYVRFYTADGKWSETVYLPDQPAKSSGFIYIVR